MEPHRTHKFSSHYCVECGCFDGGRGETWEPCPGAGTAVAPPVPAVGLHSSHDWSGFSWTCTECGCTATSFDARMQCRPSTDDSPPDPAPREIDWSKITGSFA